MTEAVMMAWKLAMQWIDENPDTKSWHIRVVTSDCTSYPVLIVGDIDNGDVRIIEAHEDSPRETWLPNDVVNEILKIKFDP